MTNYAEFLPKQLYFPAGEWPPHEGAPKLDPATEQAQQEFYAEFKSAGIDGFYDFPATPQRGLDDRNAVVTRWEPGKHAWVVLSEPGGMPLK
jgi:hypothetical protein